jgi:diacylglycerol kinase family enzyme
VHPTQSEAVGKARELAKKDVDGTVIVHGVDGTIKSSSTYGKDPYPPSEQSRVKN